MTWAVPFTSTFFVNDPSMMTLNQLAPPAGPSAWVSVALTAVPSNLATISAPGHAVFGAAGVDRSKRPMS
jgi:hypothetical protein